MELVKLNSKGQLVIPQKIRSEFKITKDSVLAVDKVNESIVIKKVDEDILSQIKNSLEDIKHGRIKRWNK